MGIYVNGSSLPKPRRNQHIQSCVRWEMANRLERLQSDIYYCYQCFDWVVGEQWEPHRQSHLAEMATKRCGTITYCHTLLRPGLLSILYE
jgi:ribosomal protein L37AE/L43A